MPKLSESRATLPVSRCVLITQLRQALYLAESPEYDAFEFELADTNFSFDFEENSIQDCSA